MATTKQNILPPKAKKVYSESINHGDKRIDYYNWLKDKSNPEVVEYLKAENEYTSEVMKDTENLQEEIFKEITTRLDVDEDWVPYKFGNYWYYSKDVKGKNYKRYFRKKNLAGPDEELILDVNEIAKDHTCCFVNIEISPDNNILAYLVDTKGDWSHTVYFKNLTTGYLLSDELKDVGGLTWYNDSKTLVYDMSRQGSKSKKVYRHIIGTPQNEDELIYEEKENNFWADMTKSNSKKYIFIYTASFITTEIYFLDADDPGSELKLFSKRTENVLFKPEHNNDKFYILTNYNAPDWKIMTCSTDDTDISQWNDYIPEKKGIKIEEFFMFKNFLVLWERDFGLLKIKVIKLEDNSSHYIEFPESVYTPGLAENKEFDTNLFRFSYVSMVTPHSFYDHDMDKQENILLKERKIPGGYIEAHVPYVDVITSLFDKEVENSTLHFDEMGNPHIKEQYEYMKSYSPYDNIREQNYCNILVTTGIHDVNVPFWHAAKFVAKLRELKTDENYVILKTDFESAHMGPSGKLDMYKEIAFEYAFILKCFGITK